MILILIIIMLVKNNGKRKIQAAFLPQERYAGQKRKKSHHGTHQRRTLYGTVQLQMLVYSSFVGQSQKPTAGQECRSRIGKQGT